MVGAASLRREMRARRIALTSDETLQAAARIAGHLATQPVFLCSRRIAAYLPVAGEADPRPLIQRAWELGKSVYLPALVPFGANRLWFLPFGPKTKLVYNRYGIPEPEVSPRKRIRPTILDLVLTPLVAFDPAGNRVGMGGGFYDNSFAFLRNRTIWRKPALLGIAYEFQRVDRLSPQPWDIPLAGAVTEAGLWTWR